MQYTLRRKDKQINREEALELLDTAEYCTISMVGKDVVPYGIPISFVRAGEILVVHCALEGRKLDCIRHQPRVSVCAVGRTEVQPAKFTSDYECVIIEGTAEIVEDEERKFADLMILCKKYSAEHLDAAAKNARQNLKRTGVIEIRIDSISAKGRKPKSVDRATVSPKELVTRWVELFNKADASGLAELYHDDAINHQVANDPIEGKESILYMFEREFAAAEMVCIVENLFEDGEWAILEWKDPLGLRGCGFFHVVDGKIKFQRGYWDKLSFLRQLGLPIPTE